MNTSNNTIKEFILFSALAAILAVLYFGLPPMLKITLWADKTTDALPIANTAKNIQKNKTLSEATESPVTNETPKTYDFTTSEGIKEYIAEICESAGVEYELVLRIAECESYSDLYNTCHCDQGHPGKGTCIENCRKGIGIFKITQTTFSETVDRMNRKDWLSVTETRISCNIGGGKIIYTPSPYDPQDNIDVALYLMQQGEYWRWEKSKWCWGEEVEEYPSQNIFDNLPESMDASTSSGRMMMKGGPYDIYTEDIIINCTENPHHWICENARELGLIEDK